MKKQHNSGASTLLIKDMNTISVLNALYDAQEANIKELAEICSLSVVTVSTIIKQLLKDGRVTKGNLAPSEGGRPSQRYVFNRSHKLGLVLFTRELKGIDSVCLRLFDLYGTSLKSEDYTMPDIDPDKIEALLAEWISGFPSVGAIGLGLPGIEHKGSMIILDYKALVGTPIIERFTSRFGIPVMVENDVNAAVIGRAHATGEGTDCEIYVYFPRKYPPGAGIHLNGRLVKGKRNFAGEIGWLPLGIEWGPETADSFQASTEAAARVLSSLSAVLDPESITIYGEHLSIEHIERIRQLCRKQLTGWELPEINLSDDFSMDYEQGMKHLTLNLLEQNRKEQQWPHYC
ncbi:ROK family transcriptional regulator [Spirochaeta dissipatitropha]